MMIQAALLAAALSCSARAQTTARKDANRYDVYQHSKSGVTLVVMTPVGKDNPDAVYYVGPKGQWLLTDGELYALGRDDGWAQIRYDIYNMRPTGMAYREDSNALGPSIYPWDGESVVTMLDSILGKLDYSQKKREAALECLSQTDEWKRRWSAAELSRKSLSAEQKLVPGRIKDPDMLASLAPKLKDAGGTLDLAKRECEYAISHDELQLKAATYWLASLHRREAAGVVAQAQTDLDWLPIPSY